MSLLNKIAAAIGVTTADVVRVATHGGTTRADWDIAHAIQAVTGRDAYEFMLLAGREQEIAEIWADSRDDTDPVAPTNPRAAYDPEVTVYGENTSPEAAPTVLPDHPGTVEDDTVEDVDEQDQATHLADTLFSDLAEVTNSTATAHLATGWHTPDETRRAVRAVLLTHPATARRARYRARLQHHLATAA